MILAPQTDGEVAIQSTPAAFVQAFEHRVRAGLLAGEPHPRSNYEVVRAGPGGIRVRAADWRTAINVGLNELELRVDQSGRVRYRVGYWRWASFAVLFSAGLGLIGLVLLLAVDARGYIARNLDTMIPGLSVDQNLLVAWVMVLFWGFVWPWFLISLHKRPLRRLVERLVGEIDRPANVG